MKNPHRLLLDLGAVIREGDISKNDLEWLMGEMEDARKALRAKAIEAGIIGEADLPTVVVEAVHDRLSQVVDRAKRSSCEEAIDFARGMLGGLRLRYGYEEET